MRLSLTPKLERLVLKFSSILVLIAVSYRLSLAVFIQKSQFIHRFDKHFYSLLVSGLIGSRLYGTVRTFALDWAWSFLPPQHITTEELMTEFDAERRYGLSTRYLSTLVGVDELRYAQPDTQPSSLDIAAALDAIADARIDPSAIDHIVYCGIERDYIEPATAHIIQERIGASNAVCYDVTNTCHGFIIGIPVVPQCDRIRVFFCSNAPMSSSGYCRHTM